MFHASSQLSPASSIRMRISSGMTSAGWVSLIWKMFFSWKFITVPQVSMCLRTTDCTVAETKKYCCLRRRDLPS